MEQDAISNYFQKISVMHKNKNKSGFEKNDRNIFIRDFLGELGYSLENILDDVSQKLDTGSRTPDIRLFGNDEAKNKHSHSQFVIETKNYNLLNKDIENIDFLQLKRYIKANQSKIRLICTTDYVSLFVFNATRIKKDPRLNLNNLNNITNFEIDVFKRNLYINVEFDDIEAKDIKFLNNLGYEAVFKKHNYIDPEEYEKTNSITESSVREHFISSLYKIMIKIKKDVEYDFYEKVDEVVNGIKLSTENHIIVVQEMLSIPENNLIRNYIFWGAEMNYILDFLTNPRYEVQISKEDLIGFLQNEEHNEAFVLTSVYNLINKTFFVRILEDIATQNTKFVEGAYNFRYLSNGILNIKLKEGEEELISYLKNVYQFQEQDLKTYSFLLKKDIYSWVLDFISPHNLLSFIRLFNDVNFKKLNQDILGDIYEHYLEQDENEDQEKTFRRLLGQYYTPKPIVSFMWVLVREVLRESDGRDLYEIDKPYLDILDPACGSGTFLSEAILQINSIASKAPINRDGKVFGFIKDRSKSRRVENHLNGFEINPLSKSIADINMFFGLTQAYGNNINNIPFKNLNIFRTDSFDLQTVFHEETNEQPRNLFLYSEDVRGAIKGSREINKAKNKKYDIIIGNPPYGYTKPNKFMKEQLIPYAYAENNFNKKGNETSFSWDNINFAGLVPEREKNIGKSQDMYSFFFGIADLLVKENGIVSYITSNTYLTIPTYKWIRKYWLENYKIHYIINFNDVSEQSNSMFAPEAGIATSIIIMTKGTDPENKIKYLDLSDIETIPDKYDAFCEVYWNERRRNKNDIQSFSLKNIANINFKGVLQKDYLYKNDYILSYSEHDLILDKIEQQSTPISTYSKLNTGVDVGDLNFLVDKSREGIKRKIIDFVFKGDFENFNKTSGNYLRENYKNKKIDTKFDKNRLLPFVYQKYIERFGYNQIHYTYLDNNILWRSRLQNNVDIFDNPITSKIKLFVLEKRSKGEIHALVDNDLVLPQHGGRFAYVIPNDFISEKELYLLSGIINSKVVQFYYRNRQQGVKDVMVKKLDEISYENKNEIAKIARKLHKLTYDRLCFKNDTINFTTEWFQRNILPNLDVINLIDGCNHWEIITEDGMYQDYTITNPELDEDKAIINLNSQLQLKFINQQLASKVYKEYLKSYTGNLMETPIIVNITKLTEPALYKNFTKLINEKEQVLLDKLNKNVIKIYNLESEYRHLNSLMENE